MRRRGTVQEPVDDYHDTARPGHEETPVHVAKQDTGAPEKSDFSPLQRNTYLEASVMNKFTSHRPPAGWNPECDEDGSILYWDGPSATVGDAAIFTDWTPGQGITIRDSRGQEVPLEDLLPFACQVLRVHSAVLSARREMAL